MSSGHFPGRKEENIKDNIKKVTEHYTGERLS
jgi:hypothetical protein